MNRSNELERDLVRWMDSVAPRQAPEILIPSVTGRTAKIRPRPGWLARLRESTMQTTLSRSPGRFGRPLALGLTLLLMLVLVAGLVAFVGSSLTSRQTLPPPFGLADNGRIAVAVDGGIVLQDSDGGDAQPLDLPFESPSKVTFSRDGTQLAAWSAADGATNRYGLVVADVDGSHAREIAPRTSFIGPSTLAWSPDGDHLAFSANADIVYVADLVEGRVDALGETERRGKEPAWAPDGRLAYRCERGGELHLCVSQGDGSGERILPTSPGTEYAFQGSAWSNDGTRIAYYINDVDGTGGWDTVVMDLATEIERNLTRSTTHHTIYPVWTPDDRYLIVNTGGPPAIVASDGSGFRLISDLSCTGPAEPSPDGRFIACTSEGGVQVVPISGGDPHVLPLATHPDSILSWQRLGQ
jgi:Tol biopolymer transport system component